MQALEHEFNGLFIGQTWTDDFGPRLRVVAIDPEMHSVEAEDLGGGVVMDTIEHFVATHHAISMPLAG